MYDMQHHQGARASGQPLAGPVPLYPYSGIGMEMQGIGMDLGEPVALYPYSGIGMDLGGIIDDAKAWFDDLSPILKAAVAAVGVYAAFMAWKKRGKIKAKLGLSKARRNGGRRRARRNTARSYAPVKARANRRRRGGRKAKRNTSHARRNGKMPKRNAKGRFVRSNRGKRRGAARRHSR